MIKDGIYKSKLAVYELLVNHNPFIREEYQNYMASRKKRKILHSASKIIILNIKYTLLRKKPYHIVSVHKYPESKQNIMPSPKELAAELSNADIVSFDIFDTLLFRPFSDPKTLFYLLGWKHGIANFRVLREKAEREARTRSGKAEGEINITDIYNVLQEWCHISAEEGVQEEIALEKELCFANPYMKLVFDEVKKLGKPIILISDMYLRENTMRELLSECGYDRYDALLISNEYLCNKVSGNLYLQAIKLYGRDKTYYHIGDNLYSDIKMAREQGWKVYHYKNINQVGKIYRPYGMSSLFGSIYEGLVNTWLYGNQEKRSLYYEHGFCCGGILAVAYCQWLEQLAVQNDIDRFWFVARDGDILYKLYKKYWGNISCEYIAFSRMASEQLIAEDYLQEYIENAIKVEIYPEPSRALTIKQLFYSLGIEKLCRQLPYGSLTEESLLTEKSYPALCQFLYENRESFNDCFSDARCGAKQYFEKKASGAKKICVVDLGWRGSSISYLKHLFEKKYDLDTEICGALLCSSGETYSDVYELFQVIHVFGCSKRIEAEWGPLLRKYWKCIEMLFSSEEPTLLAYGFKQGKPEFQYERSNENADAVRELQQGIMDFSDWYFSRMQSYAHTMEISGRDALIPLINILQNRKLAEKIDDGWRERENNRHSRGQNQVS